MFANGCGDLPVTFCQSVLRKVKDHQKPGPCNSRKKQRFVLLSRTASPVESKLTVESHRTGRATRNGVNGKTAAPDWRRLRFPLRGNNVVYTQLQTRTEAAFSARPPP